MLIHDFGNSTKWVFEQTVLQNEFYILKFDHLELEVNEISENILHPYVLKNRIIYKINQNTLNLL